MPTTVKFKFTYEIELTPEEADIMLDDLHPVSPWRGHFEIFGPGPLVYWARERDGKELRAPTMEYLTKGARQRAWKKQKLKMSRGKD